LAWRLAEWQDATGDRSDVGVVFAVLNTQLCQMQPCGGCVGQEHIRSITKVRLDAVLQQSVDDVDGGAQKLGLRADCLSDGLASVEHHLEVEVGDDRAGGADVILHAAIPNSKLVIMPGVGHVSSVEAAEQFNVEVRQFLRRLNHDLAQSQKSDRLP
jgi:hypothetical protein